MPIVMPSTRQICAPSIGTSDNVRYPCAIVVPNGPFAAFSGSTWIHWWSPVASANVSICCCVTVCQSLWPRCSPFAAANSSSPSKTRMLTPFGRSEGSVPGAAGDVHHLAGDERRLVADEERRHRGDVLRLARTPHRDLRCGGFLEVLDRHPDPLGGGGGHLGLDETGRDRVGRDAELAQLDRERLGEALQPGLRRGVVDLAPVAQRGDAGEVDDPAPPGLGHVLLRGPAHQERPPQVYAYHRVPVLVGHLEQQVVPGDPGVVDQYGRRPQLGGDAFHRGVDRLGVAHVRADREGAATGGFDRLHGVAAGRFLQVEHGHGEAVGGQSSGDGGTDAAGGAGDDGGALLGHSSSTYPWDRTGRRPASALPGRTSKTKRALSKLPSPQRACPAEPVGTVRRWATPQNGPNRARTRWIPVCTGSRCRCRRTVCAPSTCTRSRPATTWCWSTAAGPWRSPASCSSRRCGRSATRSRTSAGSW